MTMKEKFFKEKFGKKIFLIFFLKRKNCTENFSASFNHLFNFELTHFCFSSSDILSKIFLSCFFGNLQNFFFEFFSEIQENSTPEKFFYKKIFKIILL